MCAENHDADDHVKSVEAGHHEVEREEDLRVPALGALEVDGLGVEALAGHEAARVGPVAEAGPDLLRVLEVLDPEEHRAEQDRGEEEADDPGLLPDGRRTEALQGAPAKEDDMFVVPAIIAGGGE